MWFRKKRNDAGLGAGPQTGGAQLKEQAAGWIANGIIAVQIKLARILGSWEKRCNQAQKKIALLLFCAIISCYLFFSLRNALSEKPMEPKIADPAAGALSLPPVLPDIPPYKNGDTLISQLPPFNRYK